MGGSTIDIANDTEANSSGFLDPVKERELILASNRGPISFSVQRDGSLTSRAGTGGVVTAVSSIARERQPVWIACAMTEGDRVRARQAEEQGETLIVPPGENPEFRLRFVSPEKEVYDKYYNQISNPLLWFLQHYLWDTPRSPDIDEETYDSWHNGYVLVNQMFADAIVKAANEFDEPPIVMLQDYHLYLTAGYIRQQRDDVILQQFVHIPWPDPDYWRLLPLTFRRAICEGLLGNDVVGFQTPEHVRSFLYTVESYVPGAIVDYNGRGVIWQGRRVEVRDYPISIDAEAVKSAAHSEEARVHDKYLHQYFNQFTILRVDRAEPSKNIVRGFHAFDRLLQSHPELQGKVNFVAIMVPSRMDVPEYRTYLDDVSSVVGQINAKYADAVTGWQPIYQIMGENYPRALAAMKWYDVLLVNTIIDGMNLVAKEGCLLNERNGVLILSEGAGAAAQLGRNALMVSPADVEGTAEALYEALMMSPTERRARSESLRKAVEADNVAKWFEQQLMDIGKYVIYDERDVGSMLTNGMMVAADGAVIEAPTEFAHVISTSAE